MKGRGVACVACFDPATTLRKGKPCCRGCFRVPLWRWEAALEELARWKKSA